MEMEGGSMDLWERGGEKTTKKREGRRGCVQGVLYSRRIKKKKKKVNIDSVLYLAIQN